MKSKIRIALDESNEPVIKIDYEPSDDVRDDLIKRFLERYGSTKILDLYYEQHGAPNANIVIRPYTVSGTNT